VHGHTFLCHPKPGEHERYSQALGDRVIKVQIDTQSCLQEKVSREGLLVLDHIFMLNIQLREHNDLS